MAKKVTVRYVWDGRIPGSAQECGEELASLERRHGRSLTPRVVVDAARSEESPLHRCFEWNDAEAAEKFRLEQARQVIRSIRVVRSDAPANTPMRVFINIQQADEQSYVPVSRVLSEPELFERARAQFVAESERFAEKYREFEALKKLVDDMREQAVKLSA